VYFLDYTTCTEQHTLQMRCEPTTTDSDASGTIGAFLTAIDSQIYEMTIDGFRFRQAGSHVTLPAVWSGAASYGSGAGARAFTANYLDFVGRDPSGVRVRVAVFGAINITLGGDYRMSSSESSVVADAIAELTSDANMFWTVGGEVPVWNTYANLGVSAYWRNRIR
jgi:hypothetical protein